MLSTLTSLSLSSTAPSPPVLPLLTSYPAPHLRTMLWRGGKKKVSSLLFSFKKPHKISLPKRYCKKRPGEKGRTGERKAFDREKRWNIWHDTQREKDKRKDVCKEGIIVSIYEKEKWVKNS